MQPSALVAPKLNIPEIIQGAFNDALPLMRSRQRLWLIFAAIAGLGGLLLPFLPATMTSISPTGATMEIPGARLQMAAQWPNVLGAISSFFVLGSVLRTFQPSWRWTVRTFFTLLGIGIALAFMIGVASIFLVIPGIFLAVKLSQTAWCYLLGFSDNPFGESWELTKGMFWQTLLFVLLVAIVVFVLMLAFGLAAELAFWLPFAGIVLLPIGYLVYVFALHVSYLANMRWALALRERMGNAPSAGPGTVPATT
jgi:hypothetical protein